MSVLALLFLLLLLLFFFFGGGVTFVSLSSIRVSCVNRLQFISKTQTFILRRGVRSRIIVCTSTQDKAAAKDITKILRLQNGFWPTKDRSVEIHDMIILASLTELGSIIKYVLFPRYNGYPLINSANQVQSAMSSWHISDHRTLIQAWHKIYCQDPN